MTKDELLGKLSEAFARQEGLYVTEEEARRRGIRFPTLPQRFCNPGNVRYWTKRHPVENGYINFLTWAEGNKEAALKEGWRVLRALLWQYVNGKYHKGKKPTLKEAIEVYAPAADKNHPAQYAAAVSKWTGIPEDVPLIKLVDDA